MGYLVGSRVTTVAIALDSGRAHAMQLSEASSPITARKRTCGLNCFRFWAPSPEAPLPRLGSQATTTGKYEVIKRRSRRFLSPWESIGSESLRPTSAGYFIYTRALIKGLIQRVVPPV